MPNRHVSLTAVAAQSPFAIQVRQQERTSSTAQPPSYRVFYEKATAVMPTPIDRIQQAAEDTLEREQDQ